MPEQEGFTLVEIIFVLILVGIMAGIMTPLFAPGRWRADSAVQELAMSLNGAQRLAVLQQHDVVLTFKVADREVAVLQDTNNNGQHDAGEDFYVIQLPETIGFSSGNAPALPEGAGPISFAGGSGDPSLTFHRNGSASTGGVIYLAPVEGSMAGNAEGVRALTIERATGEVRCYSYRTGSWEASC